MKSILKRLYLLLVLSVGFNLQTRAQLLANPSVYRDIVSYIKKDSTYCDDSLINCHNKKIAVSALLLKQSLRWPKMLILCILTWKIWIA
jgi:hypothetical protein